MTAPSHGPPPVRTTCPYCGVGCGLLVKPDGRGGAVIAGDPDHPANFGRLCSKGSALGETLGLTGRLLHPMQRQPNGALMRIDWLTALDAVASGFKRIITRNGPDAVAFYLSGQLLTEDYYVANKLMKGFIGTANVDTNSRLCMASSVAGHRRAFGADMVPGTYEDLEEADLVVLVGSNAAWCHPVLFQRIIVNKRERGARVVVIDPRRTATAEGVDLFLSIAPGTDTALFCGLLVHLANRDALDRSYIDAHTAGFSDALARAREIAPDVATTAVATGLAPPEVACFFDLFGETERVVTCFSQGVNQSAQGTDKVNAIINCHLATGRIGRPGMGPFSLTGQPNAMGGREVGGLANQLAAHMDFSPEEVRRVSRFWNATRMATHEGLKAVQIFDAIERGEVKALWVMASNPAASLPCAAAVRNSLKKLELFVVSENVLSNDTVTAGAHVLLPAAAWGEKDGTVTNSERRISRQRAFLPLPGEAKPDWWIVAEIAKRMGFTDAFSYRSAADVFREHAALSAYENEGARGFDLGGLAEVSDATFDALDPIQWPVRATRCSKGLSYANVTASADPSNSDECCRGPTSPRKREVGRPRSGWGESGGAHLRCASRQMPSSRHASRVDVSFSFRGDAARRFFANGGFFTPDRKARFVAPEPPALRSQTSPSFPFRLNTGRVRDQWHTMTRTGKSPRLSAHLPEPFVEVHASDALAAGLADGKFARVSTQYGSCVLKVMVSEGQRRGCLFAPIHWTSETSFSARIGELVGAHTDPLSGQPEAKGTPATIAPVLYDFRGFVLVRRTVELPTGTWWSCVAVTGGFGVMLATNATGEVWRERVRAWFDTGTEVAQYVDQPRGIFRAAAFVGGWLEGCVFIGPAGGASAWGAVKALFELGKLDDAQRRTLLSGRPADGLIATGPVVCACFGVGLTAVRMAMASGAATSVEAIGAALRAGTNCGSCLPELKRILQQRPAASV